MTITVHHRNGSWERIHDIKEIIEFPGFIRLLRDKDTEKWRFALQAVWLEIQP